MTVLDKMPGSARKWLAIAMLVALVVLAARAFESETTATTLVFDVRGRDALESLAAHVTSVDSTEVLAHFRHAFLPVLRAPPRWTVSLDPGAYLVVVEVTRKGQSEVTERRIKVAETATVTLRVP